MNARVREVPKENEDVLHVMIYEPQTVYPCGGKVSVNWWIIRITRTTTDPRRESDSVFVELLTSESRHGAQTKRAAGAFQVCPRTIRMVLPIDKNIFWKKFRDIARIIDWQDLCEIIPPGMIEEILEL